MSRAVDVPIIAAVYLTHTSPLQLADNTASLQQPYSRLTRREVVRSLVREISWGALPCKEGSSMQPGNSSISQWSHLVMF